MTDPNTEQKPPTRVFKALPDLEDKQPLPLEAEVDDLLAAVMEKAGVTEAEYEEKVGQFERTDEPAHFRERRRRWLRTLLRKSLSGSTSPSWKQEQWEETWKALLQAWFTLLMRLAVYERDPSFNRYFIAPALQASGSRQVLEALMAYLEQGTNREKAGAARAFYWAWGLSAREDQRRFQQVSDELTELGKRFRLVFLKTFVECENIDVRRSIIPYLSLNPSSYPEEWRHLVSKAIDLARPHPDEYIRHRTDLQTGGSGRV